MKNLMPLILLAVLSGGCTGGTSPTNDFIPIFNGQDLEGWDYDPLYWRAENGVMIGEVTPETILRRNNFIIKKDLILKDFELLVEYRISENGNSGISYRNEPVDSLPFSLKGYQADIDGRNRYTGQNYEERGRQFLALRGEFHTIDKAYLSPAHSAVNEMNLPDDSLSRYIRDDDWNEYRIVARGNLLRHYVNGVLMSEVTDNDTDNRKMEGLLGVQVHTGPPP